MQQDSYTPFSDAAHKSYEFLSFGPKGSIKKIVRYTPIAEELYNLGFGDWDEETQMVRDDARTNNDDRDKVLATVANTVFDFMEHHPGAIIVAEGSTPARTRLYQMGISRNLAEIERSFIVNGYLKGDWELFKKGRNYQAFSLKAK